MKRGTKNRIVESFWSSRKTGHGDGKRGIQTHLQGYPGPMAAPGRNSTIEGLGGHGPKRGYPYYTKYRFPVIPVFRMIQVNQMLEFRSFHTTFSTKAPSSTTLMEQKMLGIYVEPTPTTQVSALPLAVMGFLNGLFGETGTARIRIDSRLSDTGFMDIAETRQWLIGNARMARHLPKIMEYFVPPEGFQHGVDDYIKLVPESENFRLCMDIASAPQYVTFQYKRARLEILHEYISRNSYRHLRLNG